MGESDIGTPPAPPPLPPAPPPQGTTGKDLTTHDLHFTTRQEWTLEEFIPKMQELPAPTKLVVIDARGTEREMSLQTAPWESPVDDLEFPLLLRVFAEVETKTTGSGTEAAAVAAPNSGD